MAVYKKDKSIALKGSTSSLANNLSVLVNVERSLINYAVVHKSAVNLVTMSMDGSSVNHRQITCKEPTTTHATSIILQAKLIQMAGRTLLVFASQKGIQMFEADGSVMLYWYSLGDLSPSDEMCFGRGICGVQDDTVCIGTHSGDIYAFHIPAKGTNITLSETLKGHTAGICELSSSGNRMVSSDETGAILVWQHQRDSITQLLSINSLRVPCTSVSLWEDMVVAGYSNGQLRLYVASSGKLAAEAAAHVRCINAVSVSKSGQVISVSEDSYVRIWKITSGSSPTLDHVWSESVTDVQLQGASFIDNQAKAFALTGYDSNFLYFYSAS